MAHQWDTAHLSEMQAFKAREGFYFADACKYKCNPAQFFKNASAEAPLFFQMVREGNYTVGGFRFRFLQGFLIPTLAFSGLAYYVGKSSAYLLRKPGDVLGIHH
jgi:hypothetical protein